MMKKRRRRKWKIKRKREMICKKKMTRKRVKQTMNWMKNKLRLMILTRN